MDKITVIHFSAAGTTKIAATYLAESMGKNAAEYDLLRQPQDELVILEPNNPAIFAMPVYAGRIPAIAVKSLRQFRGQKTPAIAVAVYGNREYDDALLELRNILSENGFVVVAAAAVVAQHSIFPSVAAGRPDAEDKEKIAAFGLRCSDAIANFAGTENVAVKGNEPYCAPKGVPLQPSGNAQCNGCGLCVKVCPAKAIIDEAPRKTDKDRCISCTACIAACPQKARAFHGPIYAVAAKGFEAKTKARREPEFFYSK